MPDVAVHTLRSRQSEFQNSRWQHCYCNGFIIQIPHLDFDHYISGSKANPERPSQIRVELDTPGGHSHSYRRGLHIGEMPARDFDENKPPFHAFSRDADVHTLSTGVTPPG
jgi:hypothetical protein